MKEFSIFKINEFIAVLDNRTLDVTFGHSSQQDILFEKAAHQRFCIRNTNAEKRNAILNIPPERGSYFKQYDDFGTPSDFTINHFAPCILYLIITEKCNLECKYCFIEKDLTNRDKRSMSFEVAKRAVSTFVNMLINKRTTEERPTIIFYGGEPLLNWDILKKVLLYIEEVFPKKFRLILNTNGVLLTDEIAAMLKHHSVSVSISVDGKPLTNDLMRVDSEGKGTFSKVQHAYKMLQKKSLDVGLSVTINTHNVENLKGEVEWLISKFKPKSIGLNLPYTPATVHQESPSNELVACKVLDVFDIVRSKGIFEDRVMRRLIPFTDKSFYFKDCGAIGSQLVVRADGKCGPCHALIHDDSVYTIDIFEENVESKLFASKLFKEWASRYPINMPQCSDCDAISICGGGCPYEASVKKGTIWSRDKRNCTLSIMLMRKIVNELFHLSQQHPTE